MKKVPKIKWISLELSEGDKRYLESIKWAQELIRTPLLAVPQKHIGNGNR